MSNTFIVVVLILFLGGAGAYYGHSRYGSSGLRSVIGLVLVVPFWSGCSAACISAQLDLRGEAISDASAFPDP
jgi:hypothetical protein